MERVVGMLRGKPMGDGKGRSRPQWVSQKRDFAFYRLGCSTAPADAPLSSQRSEVVKTSPSLTVQKSLLLSSEGVASKRNFFEASAPSKAEPLALRKVRAGAGLGEDLPAGSCARAGTSFLDKSSPVWIPMHCRAGVPCSLSGARQGWARAPAATETVLWWRGGSCRCAGI